MRLHGVSMMVFFVLFVSPAMADRHESEVETRGSGLFNSSESEHRFARALINIAIAASAAKTEATDHRLLHRTQDHLLFAIYDLQEILGVREDSLSNNSLSSSGPDGSSYLLTRVRRAMLAQTNHAVRRQSLESVVRALEMASDRRSNLAWCMAEVFAYSSLAHVQFSEEDTAEGDSSILKAVSAVECAYSFINALPGHKGAVVLFGDRWTDGYKVNHSELQFGIDIIRSAMKERSTSGDSATSPLPGLRADVVKDTPRGVILWEVSKTHQKQRDIYYHLTRDILWDEYNLDITPDVAQCFKDLLDFNKEIEVSDDL